MTTDFFGEIAKLLNSFELGTVDLDRSGQNLEPQGVTGKILRNKELAAANCSTRSDRD
jgi:hypothetical protein